jgi:ribosomal protein L33
VSSAEPGTSTGDEEPKKKTDKLTIKKYDPRARKHVEYKEQKMR